MRLVAGRVEVLGRWLGDAVAEAGEEAGLVGCRLGLVQDATERRARKEESEAAVAGDAGLGVGVGRGPGEPLILARVEIVGGGAGIPVRRAYQGRVQEGQDESPHADQYIRLPPPLLQFASGGRNGVRRLFKMRDAFAARRRGHDEERAEE